MSPSRASRRLGVHEHTITNRIRAAQEFLPHPIEQRACELQVALRLIRLARAGEAFACYGVVTLISFVTPATPYSLDTSS